MTLGWKVFLGTLAVASGATYYFYRKNKAMSFEKYRETCIDNAANHLRESIDVIKAILILTQKDNDTIIPILYVRHKDGKVYKTEFGNLTFPLHNCPNDVRNELQQKGEFIFHKF